MAETLNVYGAPGSSNATTIKNYFAEGAENQLEIGWDRTGTKRIITVAGQDGAAYQRFLYITPDGKNFTFADYNQIIREVKKDGPNKGKCFYTCSRYYDDKCKYFVWKDEIKK